MKMNYLFSKTLEIISENWSILQPFEQLSVFLDVQQYLS